MSSVVGKVNHEVYGISSMEATDLTDVAEEIKEDVVDHFEGSSRNIRMVDLRGDYTSQNELKYVRDYVLMLFAGDDRHVYGMTDGDVLVFTTDVDLVVDSIPRDHELVRDAFTDSEIATVRLLGDYE
jgi:hypothetical protein